MNELKCPICKETYDLDKRLPRLFPCCGHSFCSTCIQDLIENIFENLQCPEDGKKEEFFDPQKGINSFPLNYALKNILEKHQQTSSTEGEIIQQKIEDCIKDGKQEVEQEKSKEKLLIDSCQEHGKKSELVCLTDQKIICSDCVLFGKHKNHEFYKMTDFKKMVKEKIATLEKMMEDTRKKGKNIFNPENQLLELLENKVEKQRIQSMNLLKDDFLKIQKMLQKKQQEFDKIIQTNLQKFNSGIELAAQNQENLRKRQIRLNSEISEIKAQLNTPYPNFDFLVKSIYSEKNLSQLQKEIKDDELFHQNNIDKMIVQKIKDLNLKINLKRIQSKIPQLIYLKNKNTKQEIEKNEKEESFDQRETRLGDDKMGQIGDVKIDQKILMNSSSASLQNSESINFDESDESSQSEKQKMQNQNSIKNNSLSPQQNHRTKLPKKVLDKNIKKNQSFLKGRFKTKEDMLQNERNAQLNQMNNLYPVDIQNPQYYQQQDYINPKMQIQQSELYGNAFYQQPKSIIQNNFLPTRNRIESNQQFYSQRYIQGQNVTGRGGPSIIQQNDNSQTPNKKFSLKKNSLTSQPNNQIISFKKENMNDTNLTKVIKKVNSQPQTKVLNLSENVLTLVGFEFLLKNLKITPQEEFP